MDEISNIGGKRVDGEPAEDAEHFTVCPDCGQAFDMRSFAQLLHHDEDGHAPMTEAELTALSR